MQFDDQYLWLLWLVLGVAAVGLYGAWQRRRALRIFAAPELLPHIAPPDGWARPLVRLGLLTLGLVFLVAAIINPRWGEAEQQVTRRNVDLMVLLDVSRSMLARDIAPNRLERAKLSIADDLLPALGGDRIGLITFAGAAALASPLTNDYGFFRLALADVTPRSAPRGGTLIGDAIRKAADSFGDEPATRKVILLITDGEDHESFPVEAATGIWEDQDIPIVAVALGDEREGARIPEETGRGERYVEYQGEQVWSKARFDDLRRIGSISAQHAFAEVGTRNFDLGEIYKTVIVPRIEHADNLESRNVPLPSRYHPFALVTLGLLLCESVIRERRRHAGRVVAARPGRAVA